MVSSGRSFSNRGEGGDARVEVERIAGEEGVSDVFLRALAESGYFEPLEKLMIDPSSKSELKIRASRVMIEGAIEKTIEVISLGLNDTDPRVRAALVEAMKAIGLEPAVPHLIRQPKIRI